ncbi:MAG: ABC transporter substrate-binding protein [Rhodobacteraceae bacterium]|nr:ABC transporter substrate-binding protein [Paracoccaceae bacterium]
MAVAAKSAGQLDPHVSTKTEDKTVFAMLFNGLVRFAPGSMSSDSIEPDLAESWTSSEDGLVWEFKLREGVQFHGDYGELTAEDVVYSLNRAADENRSSVSSDYKAFKSVEALDDYTVRITLSEVIPSLLGVVANYHGGNIVSKKAGEELGENFQTNPIGTGPFAFGQLAEGQFVELVAHEDHFRGAPEIDKITVRYMSAVSARDLAFQTGELHMIEGSREDRWVEAAKATGEATVDVFEPGELRTLHVNTTKAPFDDIRVRQALAHAINRDELIAFAGSLVARGNEAPVPDGYIGHEPNITFLPYDPERAKELLAEAGYADGVTVPIAITERASLFGLMQVIQAQLSKVGINVEFDVMEHSAWHKAIRDDVSPLVLYGAARFPVADTYLSQFYHSDSIVKTPTAVTNFSHCDMADEQIIAARSEPDKERQQQLWSEAQQILVDNVCSVPLFELLQVWARAPEVDLGYELDGSLSLGPVITEKTTLSE